ncbi:hypothetical protein BS78_01G381000 [Paspalum vaginatum]|nr:hypothetical protein BS78_01G381000 [Paspalum vaginatum]
MKIKLVNHRWLEDCLKAWEILPVDDYSKSSWELELIEAQANDSEHEAEAAGPRSLNDRSSVKCTLNSKGYEETFVQPDADAPKLSPFTLSGNRGVVVGSNLNTPDHIMKTGDADKTHDITGQGSPNSSLLAFSAKVDVLTSIQTSFGLSEKRDNDAVRNIDSPNLQESEEKYIGARTQDLGCGVLGPPSSSETAVFSNHHLDTLNGNRGILNGHMDHVSGKYCAGHDQIDAREVLLASPSRRNQSVDEPVSSKVDRGQNQEKDGPSGILMAAADRSNNHESTPKSGGVSMSNNIKYRNNSKKASRKSLSLKRHSVKHVASPHRAEESTPRADSDISSLKMGQQMVAEHADTQSMKGNESIKSVDGLDGAYAQRRKSMVSASFNLQKEDMVSETGPLDLPFVGRLSNASEPANVSSERINLAEANGVNLGKQQFSLSTSRQTRSMKTCLKHGGCINGIKPPEYSSSDKNVKSLPQERKSPKTVAENKCTTSPSDTVQDGKTSSGFFQNKDGEGTQGRCSAVNQDFLHKIGNARTKDRIQGKSVHKSSNSQLISSSGNAGTKITDPLKDNNNVVAMVSNSEVEKLEPDASVKEDFERFEDTSSNVQGETGYSKKVRTPVKRNAGAKRPRGSSIEAEGSVINRGKKVVPESWPAEVIPHEHADPPSKNGCSKASAAELETNPPKKTPTCRVADTVAKRTRNACAKMDGAQVASCSEFSNVISHENTEINPKMFPDTSNAEPRNSPKKIPNTRVRNTAVKRSRKSDTNMSNETLVDKTEPVAAGSLFDDFFPSNNDEDCPKELTSFTSASDCGPLSPNTVSNTRTRNAVAKGKTKTVKGKLGSKSGKIGSSIASVAKIISSNRNEDISYHISEASADRGSEKSHKNVMVRDVSGLFHQDSDVVDRQEGPHNSKLRSSKRNKAVTSDYEKENRLDCSNVSSKSNKTGSLSSQSDPESMQKSTHVLSERQIVKASKSTSIMCEPTLFILSGDRQQRRDCRSILRRLKGRVCRDSHHWSCEATHFIVPDPLRRTEKFFAAAAAGRWILKPEYLTSCIEAGKFVDEEPFEWFGTGLNDGETISLDAPGKWRNIRQQMGHGAFYGMQIIIYGHLILPTLDTVKRAVKAGDGTVLATSPPYTRVLDSGVDFAVVSSSIPRADAWVQEFIRHGIPCVTADYLVEYVCKPGRPLDRHVLFKTDALASKSLEKLVRKQREVATETEPSEDDADADADEEDPENLSCSACGRKDRGEVMLICGDEDGDTGCGVGMHIDCCDPPLDAVPDDDWLCPKCAEPRAKRKPARGTERKARGSRRR